MNQATRNQVTRATSAGRAYLDLRARARAEHRATDELIQLYVLEGFLARLAASDLRDRFVLKGGVLLAALDSRRPTRDIDFAALHIDNNTANVLRLISEIASVTPAADDGLVFEPDGATADVIREDDDYSGVRVSMTTRLATARPYFHVDVNIGDPVWPEPAAITVPRLLGGQPIELIGYPLAMVHAEKLVTAVQRGTANTRWRDFADIWTLSRRHSVSGTELQQAILTVARHRKTQMLPLTEVLDGYPEIGQTKWAAWRRRQNLDTVPPRLAELAELAELVDDITTFAEPAIAERVAEQSWSPSRTTWI